MTLIALALGGFLLGYSHCRRVSAKRRSSPVESPLVKSLGFHQCNLAVSSGLSERPQSPDKTAPSTSQSPLIYSDLLRQIRAGEIKELILIPARREVTAIYPDGRRVLVPILANDQQILRTAESAGVPLKVKDIRGEQAMAGVAGNLGLILLIVVGLSFLLRRSAQVANRAMGFGRSQPRMNPPRRSHCSF